MKIGSCRLPAVVMLLVAAAWACSSGADDADVAADVAASDVRVGDAALDGRTVPDLPVGDKAVGDSLLVDVVLSDSQLQDSVFPDQADVSAGDATAEIVEQPEPVSPLDLAGWIRIYEQMGQNGEVEYSMVQAELRAEPMPTTQEPVAEAGDCVLYVGDKMMPFNCEEECVWGEELCINDECVATPPFAAAGDIAILGLAQDVSLPPGPDGSYPQVYDLPDDLFAAGNSIQVTSTGGDTPALDLVAKGVEDLIAPVWEIEFVPGEDALMTWEPGTDPAARIQLILQTGWHGSPNMTTIWCETDDDGELMVPASLTADFPIPSCGECEGSYLSRFTRDVVDFGAGPIELFVASRYWFVPWW